MHFAHNYVAGVQSDEPGRWDVTEVLEQWVAEPVMSECLMTVTETMPEGHAILDCGAALDCIGSVAAAKTAQALEAQGEDRVPTLVEKEQTVAFTTSVPGLF